MNIFLVVLITFYVGYSVGKWNARKPPQLNITVDPAVLRQFNAEIVQAWLHARGLTWTAKGADFDLGQSVKNDRRD